MMIFEHTVSKSKGTGHLKVYFALFLIQILFGINFGASKVVVTHISPAYFACLKFLISGVVLYVFAAVSNKELYPKLKTKKTWLMLVWLAFLGITFSQWMFSTGLKMSTSFNVSILTTSIPIFTLLIVWLRRQSPLGKFKLIGFVLAFLGILLFKNVEEFSFSDKTMIGDLLVIVSCFTLALQISFSKDLFEKISALWGSTFLFLVGGIALIPFARSDFSSMHVAQLSSTFFYCFFYSVFIATLLTYFLNNWCYRFANPDVISIFIYLQPVVAGIVAVNYMGETVTLRKVVCCLLLFAGMGMALVEKRVRATH